MARRLTEKAHKHYLRADMTNKENQIIISPDFH
jgi:hypothetical protein